MLKVSFKDDFKDTIVFQDKVTMVTLTGKVVMPEWSDQMPHEVTDWLNYHPSVEVDNHWNKNGWFEMTLKASGKAKCHKDDTPNSKLGERIAESRAKIRIYRFMQVLTDKLCAYYYALVYGKQGEATSNFVAPNDQTSLYLANKKYQKLLDHERHHLVELLQKTV